MDAPKPKGPGGRPPGRRYPCRVFLYVGEDEKRLLERLARKRDLSESALIRQMIRERARKEGVE